MKSLLLYAQDNVFTTDQVPKHIVYSSLLNCSRLNSIILQGLRCRSIPEVRCKFKGLRRFHVQLCPRMVYLPSWLTVQWDLRHVSIIRCVLVEDISDIVLGRLNNSYWARDFNKELL